MFKLLAALLLLFAWATIFIAGVVRVERAGADGDDGDYGDGDDGDVVADGGDAAKDGDHTTADGDAAKDGDHDADADGGRHQIQTLDGDDGDDGDGPSVWRPKYGVLDGQGCTSCSKGTKQPYYIWTKLVGGDKHTKGGMLYFEWRGDSGDVIAALLLSWVVLVLIMAFGAFFIRKKHQLPLCQPLKAKTPLWYVDFYAPIPLRTTWAELLVGLWIIGWIALCFAYVYNHAHINNLVGKIPRGFGGAVAGMLTLQLFPVSRKSVLLLAFGIPFERALKFHKKLGLWIFLFMTAHGLGMWLSHVQYFDNGTPNFATKTYADTLSSSEAVKEGLKRVVKWEIGYPHGPPLAGLIAWIAGCFVVIPAVLLRRNHWNIFVVLHTAYAILFVFAWIHYPTLMVFSAVPVLLYVVDVLARYYQSHSVKAEVIGIERFTNVIKLTLHRSDIGEIMPFQWVSIKSDDIGKGAQEWHPFSVSTSRDETFTLHIRDMGPGQWTHSLRKLAVGDEFACQGPFGRSMVEYDKEGLTELYLCAGGIGFTAILSMIDFHASQRYQNNNNVRLVVIWAFRGKAGYEPFANELRSLSQINGIEWQLHNTSASESAVNGHTEPSYYTSQEDSYGNPLNHFPQKQLPSADYSDMPFPVMYGRPHWGTALGHAQPGAAVFACGPPGLIYEVEKTSMENKLPMHKEVFEL